MYADSRIFSGAESVFCTVCANLAGRGVRIDAIVARENHELLARLESAAIACRPIPGQQPRAGAFFLYRPSRLYRVRRLLRAESPDAVLVNLPSGEYGSSPGLVAPTGIPLGGILHVHGSPGRLGFRLGGVRTLAARPAMRRMDRLFCVSPGATAQISQDWGLDRASIEGLALPRPTPPPAIDPQQCRQAFGLDPDEQVVLLLGRLSVKQKGHDVLLRAAALLLRRRPGLRVLVVGDGPDRLKLGRLADQLGIGGRVTIVPGEDGPWAALAAADVIALPSRFEGLPLVAIEALEASLAGVACSVDGLVHIWPEPWQVPPGDPQALAARLDTVLACPAAERQKILVEARDRARSYTSATPEEPVYRWLRSIAAGQSRSA